MNAYVKHGSQEAGRIDARIKRFSYYGMRGETLSSGNQDSGLEFPDSPFATRSVYKIYRTKTA